MIKVMIGDIGLKVDFAVSDAGGEAEAIQTRSEEREIYDSFMKDVAVFADMLGDAAKLAEFREHIESATPDDFAQGESDTDD